MSKILTFKDEKDYYKYCSEHSDRVIVVYNEDVFDVTDFVDQHPGGSDVFEDYNTNDITDLFHATYPHAHTKHAVKKLYRFKIGHFEEEKEDVSIPQQSQPQREEETQVYPYVQDNKVVYKKLTLDLNKGFAGQVKNLDKNQYIHMLRNPLPPTSFRVTDNCFLEGLINPARGLTLLVWMAINFYLLNEVQKTQKFDELSLLSKIFYGLIGGILGSLVEYLLYRFVYSVEERIIDNKFVFWLHFIIYGKHQIAPSDQSKTGTPLIFGFSIFFSIYLLLNGLFSEQIAIIIWTGVIISFFFYEALHIHIHSTYSLPLEFITNLRKYHLNWHNGKGKRGFGVATGRLWNYILGTESE